MKAKSRQFGLTLPELIVVIASIVVLVGVGLPAVRALFTSFESGSSTKAVISGALATARAIAAREHRYAGIRFQKAYNPEGPLKADQYMIFIVHDPEPEPNGTDLANGFRAVEGLKPIKLPESVGVMDFKQGWLGSAEIVANIDFVELGGWPVTVVDTTTFSIVFSPSGKLVIHDVRVRNRNGRRDSSAIISYDDVFNKKREVDGGIGVFYQDDYFAAPLNLGLGPEPSRNSFFIYDRKEFKQAYDKSMPYSGYLQRLVPQERIHINPYMGTMISRD